MSNLKIATILVLGLLGTIDGQTTWYKFDKQFVAQHYQEYSAIGTLRSSEFHPAKSVHSQNCGGNDGELHIGIPQAAVAWNNVANDPISANANEGNDNDFGLVAEPPNVDSKTKSAVQAAEGNPAKFFGFFRVWNEGHDVGTIYPSNPHHVMEIHPVWGFQSGPAIFQPDPKVIFSMKKYSGYGASHFRTLLSGVPQWLRVAEDQQFIYVQLRRADNFYQLPIIVKRVRPLGTSAITALVDVYSDVAHQNLVYRDLTIMTARGSRIASQLKPGLKTYVLGFFSVNLPKAIYGARGHIGISHAIPYRHALEFFAFGVPLNKAVSSSNPCVEEDD